MKMNWVILAALLSISGFAHSQPIRVLTEDWPPYNFLNQEGEVVGKSTTLVRKVLDKSGLAYKIELYPWARSYQIALAEKNTLLYTIIKDDLRTPLFHWLCPIHEPVKVYFYKLRHNDRVTLSSPEDAKRYRVGVARDDWNEGFLLNKGFKVQVNLDVAATDDANLQTLLAGRIDLMLNSEHAMKRRLKKVNLDYSHVEKAYPHNVKREDPSCMAINKDSDPALIRVLQKAFDDVMAEQALKGVAAP